MYDCTIFVLVKYIYSSVKVQTSWKEGSVSKLILYFIINITNSTTNITSSKFK